MNKGIKDTIELITTEYRENPLSFFNEQDIVCHLIEILKGKFPDKIKITSQAIMGRHSFASRIHTEVDIPIDDNQSGRRPKVDIAIYKNKNVELKGYRYNKTTPSSETDVNDILFGIEVKFYRGVTKQFRPSEIKGLEKTAEKLHRLKDKSILLIFTHVYIKGDAREILDTIFKGLNVEVITSGMWNEKK
jgi:hypothetical protein